MRLTIIGASGHGKVVADIAKKNGYREIVFLDDNISVKKCGPYSVIGKTDLAKKLDGDFFVGIGDSIIREKIMNELNNKIIVSLIHPKAVVAEDVIIGSGTVVMAGAVINSGTTIGNGVIINTCSSVDHDCIISNFVHVSVGVHLCGNVAVGEHTWIGAGSTIINNIRVVDNCIVGAGAVVVGNIDCCGKYVGVPAKMLKEK